MYRGITPHGVPARVGFVDSTELPCVQPQEESPSDPGIDSTLQSGEVGMIIPTAFDLFTGDKMRSEAIIIPSDDFK